MNHIITVAVVNFSAVWGNKERNRERLAGYIRSAAKQGVDLILFPELALTGYDDDALHTDPEEKMHRLMAETLPGETSDILGAITKKYGIYAVFGMPERDKDDPSRVYNAAAILGPDGFITSYRKRNLPNDEQNWATSGKSPIVFDTPWGPIGVGICADVYDFPEFTRYACAKGARLFLNPTAMPLCVRPEYPQTAIESLAATCAVYIASADLYGLDRINEMMGGSSVIGPGNQRPNGRQWIHYYAGKPFCHPDALENEMYIATIDLTLVERSYSHRLWAKDQAQWDPQEFIELYKETRRGETTP